MTHTYATLDVSAAAYEEIKQRLEAVGQPERLYKELSGRVVLDLNGVALSRETDERVQVYIVFDGKRLKPPEVPRVTDKPAAKSSTSVLQAGVCQSCGCPLDGEVASMKPGCQCRCHS